MTTHLVTLLVLLVLAPSDGWALTAEEIGKFKTKDVSEQSQGLKGRVQVTVEGDDLRLRSNSIPDHAAGTFQTASNPFKIEEQDIDKLIPNNPEIAEQAECLPMGPIAIAKNGVAIYNPYNMYAENAVEGDTAEVFDDCLGHPSPHGMYHYHQTPRCLYENTPDEFIGVALDGFPIYGSKNSSGTILTPDDLDNCNGHMAGGQYRYRLTSDFPYVMGCFKGVIKLDDRQRNRCYFVSKDGHSTRKTESTATSIHTAFITILSALLLTVTF